MIGHILHQNGLKLGNLHLEFNETVSNVSQKNPKKL